AVKLSRDAELYLDDEFSGDLLEKIKASLPQRETGNPMRFLYPKSIPDEVLHRIVEALELSKNDLIPGGRYHNFKDFFGFPEIADTSLYFKVQPPLDHAEFKRKNLYEQVLRKDVLLQFPYQKFDYLPQLLAEIIASQQCKSIRISLYRVAKDSAIAKLLLDAVRQGIRVFVFIETKARFDEANNLFWGEALEKAGATVRYSYPGIKVHSKILLIETHTQPIAYISTGNFNHKTAKIYGDFALFTSNSSLTKELQMVFEVLEGQLIVPKLKHLLVSPFNTRAHFLQLVDDQIHKAKQDEKASISLKMNSLQDFEMIEKLYEASQAGVEIRLLIRGICGLKPGIPGISENIRVKSIVDRYLEHSRIYCFGQGKEQQIFIGSADWMTRNLDHRIEVLTPIYQENIKHQLLDFFELQWSDNTKSRIIDAEQKNTYYSTDSQSKKVRAQEDYYDLLQSKLQ
ncbi:MAG: polyphosphate kinase 1, partial [Flavobacteriaceae bacterium]|nr:polyphosphate kinase 1 [Flavobacteriaceae bacterium]